MEGVLRGVKYVRDLVRISKGLLNCVVGVYWSWVCTKTDKVKMLQWGFMY